MLLASVVSQSTAAVLSVVASFIFVLGLALQQRGNLAAMREKRAGTSRRPTALATVLQPAWILGLAGCGGVGFLVLATAYNIGSISIVSPIQVTQMIFTVPLSAWVARTAVERKDWRAAFVLVAGLAVVVLALAPEPGRLVGDPAGWRIVTPVVLAVSALFVLTAWRVPAYAAALFGAASGMLFGLQGALLKELTSLVGSDGFTITTLLTFWGFWASGVFTVLAVVIQNLALRAGRLSAAQTTVTTIAPLMSTFIGVAVFGETVQVSGLRVAAALVGAVVCGWGIAQLARSSALLAAHGELGEIDEADDAVVAH